MKDLDHDPNDSNAYSELVPDQKYALIPNFVLESGIELKSVPVAYKTWGVLNHTCNNVLVVCHALSGSCDVNDWWGPLMGPGKAFDYTRYFVFCANALGSPYGSASSVTKDPSTGNHYGPRFHLRRIRKHVLDSMGVRQVAAVVGGSMGGMTTLEWPLCTPLGYVCNIIPIATSTSHNAWGISWAEVQRQCILTDAKYDNGNYRPEPSRQPTAGLAAARMVGMLTYRSSASFETRFGRRKISPRHEIPLNAVKSQEIITQTTELELGEDSTIKPRDERFSAQMYLDYQGEKFLRRFDANCYIHLTRKMDQHDVLRGRANANPDGSHGTGSAEALATVLKQVPPKALVIGIETDVLFRPEHQTMLAQALPDALCFILESENGHDGFLLEFEILNQLIIKHLQEQCPQLYEGSPFVSLDVRKDLNPINSVFGEVDAGWK